MTQRTNDEGQQRTNDDNLIFQLYVWGDLYVMRNAMRRWK